MPFYNQRQLTAAHEAGHATAAVMLGMIVEFATIQPTRENHGCVRLASWDKCSISDRIVARMSGPISENKLANPNRPCELKADSRDYAMVLDLLSTAHGTDIKDADQSPLFHHCRLATYQFVLTHWGAIRRVADLLLTQTTVRHSDIVRAM